MTIPITILYATVSGNSQECAEQLGDRLADKGYTATVTNLADYLSDDILKEQIVLICISTYGDGDVPDDGMDFMEYLEALTPQSLTHLRFSIFALGDTTHNNFCQCGKDLDALLEKLGAQRIAPRVDTDVDIEEPFNLWVNQVSNALEQIES